MYKNLVRKQIFCFARTCSWYEGGAGTREGGKGRSPDSSEVKRQSSAFRTRSAQRPRPLGSDSWTSTRSSIRRRASDEAETFESARIPEAAARGRQRGDVHHAARRSEDGRYFVHHVLVPGKQRHQVRRVCPLFRIEQRRDEGPVTPGGNRASHRRNRHLNYQIHQTRVRFLVFFELGQDAAKDASGRGVHPFPVFGNFEICSGAQTNGVSIALFGKREVEVDSLSQQAGPQNACDQRSGNGGRAESRRDFEEGFWFWNEQARFRVLLRPLFPCFLDALFGLAQRWTRPVSSSRRRRLGMQPPLRKSLCCNSSCL